MSSFVRRPEAAMALLVACLATGCADTPSRPKPTAAAVAACRGQTEQVFNRQNRDLLSYRDGRDTPFSDSYNSGITSAGLTRQYERDQLYSSCLNATGGAANPGDDTSFRPSEHRPADIERTLMLG